MFALLKRDEMFEFIDIDFIAGYLFGLLFAWVTFYFILKNKVEDE